MRKDHLPPRELEKLSAYIDGELQPRESRKLEARLKREPALREAYHELQLVAKSMRQLPQVRPPQSFTLSPEMVGVPQRRTGYPVLRLATVVAAFAFVALIGVDIFSSSLRGGLPARALDQVALEAPSFAEGEALGAVEQQVEETEPMAEAPAAAMRAGEEQPAEEPDADTLAAAPEPAEEQEAPVAEEGMVVEESPETPPEAESEVYEPEGTAAPTDETAMKYSVTEMPATEEMLNEPTFDEVEIPSTTVGEETRRARVPSFWLRGIEIALGILTLLLAGLTLWARKPPR